MCLEIHRKQRKKYLTAFEVSVDNILDYMAINTMQNDQIRANFHFVPVTKMQVKFKEIISSKGKFWMLVRIKGQAYCLISQISLKVLACITS